MKHRNDYYREAAYKALRGLEGKYVTLIIGAARQRQSALYAGETDGNNEWSSGTFLTSKEEDLDGTVYFNGYWNHLCGISVQGEDTFHLCDKDAPASRIHVEGIELEELIKIWEKKEKLVAVE